MKNIKLIVALFSAFSLVGCGSNNSSQKEEVADLMPEKHIVYGVDADLYELHSGEVKSGETMGEILGSLGMSAYQIDQLDRATAKIYPLRNIRSGHKYTAFVTRDSLGEMHVGHFAYERNRTDYVRFCFEGDSIATYFESKPFTVKRMKKSATINSSLWGAIMEAHLPYSLAAELEEIYQWTVDFFGIQKGDNFTAIYDERFIDDTVSVGIARVWGAQFNHGGKEYYAIPFPKEGKIKYWEADGASLRKQLLKAPLKYTRISSRFTYARKHPIYKVYRPHTGVDYAAPKGTPIHSVADGVVIFKGWGGGGGNTLKIKHTGSIITGYLHMSRYAKSIHKGSHVTQGQVIGYVGSTGASTGPHLDYRIWKNGKPVDPLKIPQEPAEPIAKQDWEKFVFVRDRIIEELHSEIPDEKKITQLDSITLPVATTTTEQN